MHANTLDIDGLESLSTAEMQEVNGGGFLGDAIKAGLRYILPIVFKKLMDRFLGP